jgi:hypothetical protein
MEAMLGISLYSCPYLHYQKLYVFLIIGYFYSSTELEKSAKHVLPRSEGGGWENVGAGDGGRNDPNNVCT